MIKTEAEAIEALHRFRAELYPTAAPHAILSVERSVFDGRDCWAIDAWEPLGPGEPAWFRMHDPAETYMIDTVSGHCLALQGARSVVRFSDAEQAGDQVVAKALA